MEDQSINQSENCFRLCIQIRGCNCETGILLPAKTLDPAFSLMMAQLSMCCETFPRGKIYSRIENRTQHSRSLTKSLQTFTCSDSNLGPLYLASVSLYRFEILQKHALEIRKKRELRLIGMQDTHLISLHTGKFSSQFILHKFGLLYHRPIFKALAYFIRNTMLVPSQNFLSLNICLRETR